MKVVALSGSKQFYLLLSIILIDQFLKYKLYDLAIYNPGIGLGLFGSWNNNLIFGLAVILLFVAVRLWVKSKHFFNKLGWLMVISGALSNLIDRVIYGHIVDPLILFGFNLNLADIVISVGIILILIEFRPRFFLPGH